MARVSWQPTTSVRSYNRNDQIDDEIEQQVENGDGKVEEENAVQDETHSLLPPSPPIRRDVTSPSSFKKGSNRIEISASSTSVLALVLTVSVLIVLGDYYSSSSSSSQRTKTATTTTSSLLSALVGESVSVNTDSSIMTSGTAMPGYDPADAEVQKIVYIIRHGEKIRDPNNATDYLYACLNDKGYARADHLIETFITDNTQNLIVPDALFSFNYDNGNVDCRDPVDHIYRTQATLRPLGKELGIPINNYHGAKPDLCGLGTIADQIGITDADTDLIDYDHKVCRHPKLTGSVHDFGMCCNLGAADAIRDALFEDPTTTSSVFVAWEHANIGYLSEALMINDDTVDENAVQIGQFISNNPAFKRMMYWPDSRFDEILTMWFDPITKEFLKIDTESYVQGFGD